MKKVVRLSEQDLVGIIRRIINESEIPSNYIKTDIGNILQREKRKRIEDMINNMNKRHGTTWEYYEDKKKNVSFISDGNLFYIINAPNFTKGIGPHEVETMISYL